MTETTARPISLRDLQQRRHSVPVAFYDMESQIEYDPTQFTGTFKAEHMQRAREINDRIREAREEARQNGAVFDRQKAIYQGEAELMLEIVKDWNIVGLDGEKVPLTVEAVMDNLTPELVVAISSAVWGAVGNLGAPASSSKS